MTPRTWWKKKTVSTRSWDGGMMSSMWGALKVLTAEIENYALQYPGVERVEITARPNPLTGQHVEMRVQERFAEEDEKKSFQAYLRKVLPSYMVPRRVKYEPIAIGHRFKTR